MEEKNRFVWELVKAEADFFGKVKEKFWGNKKSFLWWKQKKVLEAIDMPATYAMN